MCCKAMTFLNKDGTKTNERRVDWRAELTLTNALEDALRHPDEFGNPAYAVEIIRGEETIALETHLYPHRRTKQDTDPLLKPGDIVIFSPKPYW